jgi:hypothetical protein
MPEEVERLVRFFYDGFNRNKRTYPDLWHPDGEYINAREDPDHGTHRGIDSIQKLASSWVDAYTDLCVEPLEIRPSGDKVLVWVRFSGHGTGSGVPMDMELAHVWTVEDAKIRRIEEYFDRAEALEVAGLRERALGH